MESHLLLMVIFALCVSIVFAALLGEDSRQQLIVAAKMFGAMVAAALILGWLMLPFPI